MNSLAQLRTEYTRRNQTPFVNNEIQKAIIIRRNNVLKDRNESKKKSFCKQGNICVNTLRKTKKEYYSNLEVSKVAGNKKFWKTVKNFFSDKSNNFGTINLVENNIVISDDQRIAHVFY